MTFSTVSNLVPATLAGKTLQIYQNGALVATSTFGSDRTFNEIDANGHIHYGTYTLTQYSPTVGIVQAIHTDLDEAGALSYTELTFTSTTAGQAVSSYYSNPAYGRNPDAGEGPGTFKLK